MKSGMPVRRRKVFYIPGYDPRSPSVYHDLLAGGLVRAAPHRGFSAEAGPYLDEKRPLIGFSAQAQGEGWHTDVDLALMRWEDVLRKTYSRSVWPRLPAYAALAWHLVRCGLFRRAFQADYRFFAFLIYPFLVTVLALTAVLGISAGAGLWLDTHVPGVGWLLFLAAVCAGAYAFDQFERRAFVRYLLEDWLFTFAVARAELPEMGARLDAFADAVIEAGRSEDYDEVLIVGHSTGSYFGVEVMARALERAPDLGRGTASVSLLTVGSLVSLMALYPPARPFRDRVGLFARQAAVPWMEVQARIDVISLPWTDPLAAAGMDMAQRESLWPLLLRMNLNSEVEGVRDTIWQRLRLFAIHFRYFSPVDPQGRLDVFSVIAGPQRLLDRHPGLLAVKGDVGAGRPDPGNSA